MTLTWRDGVATLLVAAIVVPFFGYLLVGGMPLIQDPTGMAGAALVLGALAALVGGWFVVPAGTARIVMVAIGVVSAAMGILALVSQNLLDLAVRQWMLGGLMAGIVALWTITLLRHAGVIEAAEEPTSGYGHA